MKPPPEASSPSSPGGLRDRLRGRLIRHFLLVIAVPVLTLPLLTLTYLHRNSLQAKSEDSLGKAISHSRFVETLLEKRAIELLLIGQFPETRRVINAVSPEDTRSALETLSLRLQSYFLKHSGFVDGFRLLDVRGRERLNLRADGSTPAPGDPSLLETSSADYFVGAIHLAALRGRRIPVHISQPDPQSPLHYSSLVMDDQGVIAGVIVLEVGLPGLLADISDGGPGSLCNLFDATGQSLFHETIDHGCPPIAPDFRGEMLRRESGRVPFTSRFPSSFRVFSRIQPPGQSTIRWTAVYDVPLNALDAPFRTAVAMVGYVTLATVFLSLALALAFSRQITRPLTQLATAADDLCQGYWDTLMPRVRADDEIHALIRAFSSMSRQLRGAHESLLAKVTALGSSEQQLAEEKERLAVTLRSIGDAVIATDLEGRILLANPVAEKLLGFPADLLLGRPLQQQVRLTDTLSGEEVTDIIRPALRADGSAMPEHELHLANHAGEEFLVETKASPIHNPRSETVGAVVVLRDVSRIRQRSSEQHRLEKLESLGLLAGGIAHDFNNLISVVMGDLSLLSTRHPPGDEDHDVIENAGRATRRARGLTRQLLTFAKGGAPVKRSASLRELVEESARFAMHGSKCTFRLEAPADLWACEVDSSQMHQVFHNLSLNAVQAMPTGGTLSIQLKHVHLARDEQPPLPPGPYIRVVLRDQGPGIPPHRISRVFDPYYTTKDTGQGLGLSSVHSIVGAHQGHISVASSSAGTEFTLLIPAQENVLPPATPVTPPPKPPPAPQPLRVLLLDDAPDIRATAGRLLQHLGHRVESVDDGKAALRTFEKARAEGNPYDLLLLDLTIPGGMGGRETLAEILKINPGARAIVTSGYSQDDVMSRHHDYGFRSALQKPFSLEELRHAIAESMAETELP